MTWVRLHADPGRTIMIASKRTFDSMIGQLGDEWFMIFWHTTLVGWIVRWKQGVEKATKFAFAYEPNVADLHRLIWVPWTWLPQSMSVRRIFNGKLFAKNIAVGHRGSQESRITTERQLGCVWEGLPRISHMTQNNTVTILRPDGPLFKRPEFPLQCHRLMLFQWRRRGDSLHGQNRVLSRWMPSENASLLPQQCCLVVSTVLFYRA